MPATALHGFPSRRAFREIAARVLESGPDVLEIGLPFSDPLADGPVIEAAGQRSLAHGAALATTLEDVAWLAARFGETPLVLMSYFNPLRAYGLASLTQTACVLLFPALADSVSLLALSAVFGFGFAGDMTCFSLCVRRAVPAG